MSNGLYDAVAAMAASEKRLDVISQNLANSSSAGYKRQVGSVHSFDSYVDGAKRSGQILETQVDFTQGDLVATGNELDLALLGDGFFAFEDGQDLAYSRDGALRLTEAGDLVSKAGRPVVWEDHTGQIQPTGEGLRIDLGGNVFQGNTRIGQLRTVDFVDKARLTQDDTGYFRAPADMPEEVALAEVHAGSYEAPNVRPVAEMVEMILAQRAYQSASNTVTQISDSYRRLNQAR